MKEIINYLTLLDFSRIEIKLYLLLLKSGPMSVSQLAAKARINRTAAYAHINTLFAKGVLIKTKGPKNEISANHPENLKYLIESKKNKVERLESEFPQMVESLSNNFSSLPNFNDSEIKYYKGRPGAKIIYDDCLKSKELRSYFNGTEIEKVFPGNLELFCSAFNTNPDIIMYEIREDSHTAQKQLIEYLKVDRYFYKFFPPDVKLFANDILIYDGKVAIINVRDKNNIHGMIISNEDYYNNSKLLFDLLWRFLPEPK